MDKFLDILLISALIVLIGIPLLYAIVRVVCRAILRSFTEWETFRGKEKPEEKKKG